MTRIRTKPIESRSCTLELRLHLLARLPFFAELTADDIARISQDFHERSFSEGQTIYTGGEPARWLYVVAAGQVKLLRPMPSGQNVLLDILGQGDFFGSLSTLGDRVYPDSAEALTTCCVLAVDAAAFHQILQRYPAAALTTLGIVSERLRTAHDLIEGLSGHDVEQRIAMTLLRLAARAGERREGMLVIQLPLSRQDLADMVGTTRETASRVISQLDRDGVIHSGRGWIGLIDLDQLAAIAEGDAG